MRARISQMGLGSIITIIVVVGAIGLGLFISHERDREMNQWRDKLDLIADARARDVSGFVQTQFRELSALADNASLQIYFTQLQNESAEEEPAQAQYLRNLLTLTSQRLGFEPEAASMQQQLGANVRPLAVGGLALIDRDGKLLMATGAMPPIEGALRKQITEAKRGEASLMDITITEEGTQRMGFIVPVYGVQAEHDATSQIGMLVGMRALDKRFTALLSPQPASEKTLEVALVRAENAQARYLTPLMDDSPIMSRTQPNNDASAAAYALSHPNSFAEKTDYRGKEVLMSTRAISGTQWALIAKIDRDEALAGAATWRNTVAATIMLLIAALAATIIAVWRHASAREQAALAAESGARAELLSVVTDNQTEQLYMVDAGMQVYFANRSAADAMQTTVKDMRGKTLASIMGAADAMAISAVCMKALNENTAQTTMIERIIRGETHSMVIRCIPLAELPVTGTPKPIAGVLIVEHDMTPIMREREIRVNTLNQLVAMLVSLVDKRDPNAAQHSARVADIALHTATAMGLDPTMIETTAIAARLMNLGKVDIPAELLTRDGTLNQAERDAIRSSLATSANLLRGIAFTGPVAETLQQAQEHVDGSGPLRLKQEDILISARIIAAANALVGMRSPRSYRPAMPWEEVVRILNSEIGTHFDRKVISAILHYLDNQGGRERFEHFEPASYAQSA